MTHDQLCAWLREYGADYGYDETDFNPFQWAADEIERLQRANSARPDYNLHCDECGRAHILDTSIPSDIWNQIAPEGGVLCTLCIDGRMAKLGLTCEAEFYFVGKALRSKLYAISHGDLSHYPEW